jgi:hypothetical protein
MSSEVRISYTHLPIREGEIIFKVVNNGREVLEFSTEKDWGMLNDTVQRCDESVREYVKQNPERRIHQIAYDTLMDDGIEGMTRAAAALWMMAQMDSWRGIPATEPDHLQLDIVDDPRGGISVSICASHRADGGIQ